MFDTTDRAEADERPTVLALPEAHHNRIVYFLCSVRNDPDRCILEVIYLASFCGKRPKREPVQRLGDNEDRWKASELGFLARVFNQETKVQHFHTLLEQWLQR